MSETPEGAVVEAKIMEKRPTSFKVKLQVEHCSSVDLEEEGKENEPPPQQQQSTRPYSENSWKDQLMRLVREAPQPVPVLCSEPRRFPHVGVGNRLSDASWTSDTTRFTGITTSRPSSLDATINGADVDVGKDEEEEDAPSISQDRTTLSSAKNRSSGSTVVTPPQSEGDDGDGGELCNLMNDEKGKEEGKTEKSPSLPSEALPLSPILSLRSTVQEENALGLGESSAGAMKHDNEAHQMQKIKNTRSRSVDAGRSKMWNKEVYEDPEYWEKFRNSKDYQSSLMIETICNEVFNLKPSPRYKSLMKLSLKNRANHNKNIKGKKGSKEGSAKSHNIPEKNGGGGGENLDGKLQEDVGKIIEERCSIAQSSSIVVAGASIAVDNDDDDHEKERDETSGGKGKETCKIEAIIKRSGRNSNSSQVIFTIEEDEIKWRKKHSATSTVSSAYTATTSGEEEGDESGIERMRTDEMLLVKGFGRAFHGYLTKCETDELLERNGQYLVRQMWKEDGFILSLRFDDEVRNYRIICSATTPTHKKKSSTADKSHELDDVRFTFYLDDRRKTYHSLDELVRDGLLTLHLDENAGSYIDLLMELAQQHNFLQTPPAVTPSSRKNSRSTSFHRMFRLNSSSSAAATVGGGGGDVTANGDDERCNSLSKTSPPGAERESQSLGRNIALFIHFFEEEIFDGLAKCQVCSHGLWGPTNKGLRCRDCRLAVHESCTDKAKDECRPDLSSISPFSTDLTTLVKGSLSTSPTEGSSFSRGPPYIVEKCINEMEAKGGLTTEGIYRISGSLDEIEKLKNLFDKDRINTNLSTCSCDIHSITGLIKFFFRQLPDALITKEVFEEFIQGEAGEELTSETVQILVSCLPPAHRITLKYLLEHLNRVTMEKQENRMNAFNLSSVLMPSVIGPVNMNFDVLERSTKLLHFLIVRINDIQF